MRAFLREPRREQAPKEREPPLAPALWERGAALETPFAAATLAPCAPAALSGKGAGSRCHLHHRRLASRLSFGGLSRQAAGDGKLRKQLDQLRVESL
jgi:hypothetical protein